MLRESFRRSVEIPEIIVKTGRAQAFNLFFYFLLAMSLECLVQNTFTT